MSTTISISKRQKPAAEKVRWHRSPKINWRKWRATSNNNLQITTTGQLSTTTIHNFFDRCSKGQSQSASSTIRARKHWEQRNTYGSCSYRRRPQTTVAFRLSMTPIQRLPRISSKMMDKKLHQQQRSTTMPRALQNLQRTQSRWTPGLLILHLETTNNNNNNGSTVDDNYPKYFLHVEEQ